MSQPRIRVTWGQLVALLAGKSVTVEHRGTTLPPRERGLPVELREDAGVRVQVVRAERIERASIASVPDEQPRGRARRQIERWRLEVRREDAPPPTLLRAESGASVTPLGERADPSSPEARGYTPNPQHALDAGEVVPSEEVETFAAAQESRARFAAEKVDVLAKRQANALARRTREALMQARAHGVDATDQVAVIEAALAEIHEAVRVAREPREEAA